MLFHQVTKIWYWSVYRFLLWILVWIGGLAQNRNFDNKTFICENSYCKKLIKLQSMPFEHCITHRLSWWWNGEVGNVIGDKRRLHKIACRIGYLPGRQTSYPTMRWILPLLGPSQKKLHGEHSFNCCGRNFEGYWGSEFTVRICVTQLSRNVKSWVTLLKKSWIFIYKRGALKCGSYQGIKLLDQVMNVLYCSITSYWEENEKWNAHHQRAVWIQNRKRNYSCTLYI